MRELIDLLHLLSCHQEHEMDMMKVLERPNQKCYYYLENDIDDGQSMKDHLHWIAVAEKFKTTMSFKTDTEALNFLREALQISHQLQALVQGDSFKLAFIKNLLST